MREHLDRVIFRDNLVLKGEDPGFVDREAKHFQLKDDSPVYRKIPGLERIPFERIGLFTDEYRLRLPE